MKKFYHTLLFLTTIHLAGLFTLFLFRTVKYLALSHLIEDSSTSSVWPAFLRGLWFDNVISCYAMIIPLLIVLIATWFGNYSNTIRKIAVIFLSIVYSILFMASAADIPYFAFFFKGINSSIFGWFSYTGTTARMVFEETSFLFYILLYFVLTTLFIVFIKWTNKRTARTLNKLSEPHKKTTTTVKTLLTLTLIGGCIFGMRGRTGYNPIKISEAYYCNDSFLNQLGINPFFNLLTSTLDDIRPENKLLHLANDAVAINYARQSLGIYTQDKHHPLLRHICAEKPIKKRNVVFIFMESMSANFLHSFGLQNKELTPTLDSLYKTSLVFTNFYSAGIHTNHGITASLYSMPAIMKRNLMKGTVTPHRKGLPTILKDKGYHNIFFMTHESQYDNLNAFLLTNGYDEIYSKENYPSSAVVNSFGVSDNFMFNYSLPVLRRANALGQPFLATLLTISNHPPYVIPSDFHAKSTEPETQIVEYADWSIKQFLEKAKKEPWYSNTIFVLVADHGKLVGKADGELPQSYNHIPLFIFGPDIPIGQYTSLGEQIDIVPTLLGLMNVSYDYEGFGVDLLKTKRKSVFYSADNLIVDRDNNHCLLFNPATHQTFNYKNINGQLLPQQNSKVTTQRLRTDVFNMMQTAEYIYHQQ